MKKQVGRYFKSSLYILVNCSIYFIAFFIINSAIDWHSYTVLDSLVYPVYIYIIGAFLNIAFLFFLFKKEKIVKYLIFINGIIITILFLILIYIY